LAVNAAAVHVLCNQQSMPVIKNTGYSSSASNLQIQLSRGFTR